MNAPRYSYSAINALSSGDTGHFVFLDAWTISLLGSMLSQERLPWLWYNNQFPLTQAQIDDLDNRLSTAQGQLMQTMLGLIMPICSQAIPQGALLCDGSTYLRVDYPNLYDALDTFYHVDSDSFTVPDLRDRFVLGTGPTHAQNTNGGASEQTLTEAQLPSHTHTSPPHAHTEVISVPTIINGGLEAPASAATPTGGTTGLTAVTIDPTGGGEAIEIMPPFVSLRYVVVAL